MRTIIDPKLIVRLKRDDISALGELYELLSKKIYNRCIFLLKDQDWAKDATQDVFLKAFFRIETLKEGAKIEAWLNRIAYNYCIDKIRETKRDKVEVAQIETVNQLSNFLEEIDEISESESSVAALRAEIELLSESERIIIMLFYWEGMRISDISDLLNLGDSAVKMKLSRTRTKLKDRLSRKGINHSLVVSLLIILDLV